MLHDLARTPVAVMFSTPCGSLSLNDVPARGSRLGTMTPVSGVTTPCSMAAAIVMSLPVEPGSKASWKAWLASAACFASAEVVRVEGRVARGRPHLAGRLLDHDGGAGLGPTR